MSAGFDVDDFAAALLDPARAVPPDIVARGAIGAETRFAVYRNNVVQDLVAALETRFPAVRRVVGEAFFSETARLYARKTPPRSPIMSFYGDDFPNFLADFSPCGDIPYLADLARLESARTRAYHAADAAALETESFAGLTPAVLMDLRIALHPSVEILASAHPIATIFAMNMGELPLEEIADWQREEAVVVRPYATVEVRRLPQGGSIFLTHLSNGATLAEAAEAAMNASPDFDLTLNLTHLIGGALVTAIATQPHLQS
ncbi:MAG: DNA-binding domain-containing protein [Methylovirgula sp.]|jgi:hypothetical protein